MIYLNKKSIQAAMRSKNIKTYTELADRLSIERSQLSQMLNTTYSPVKKNALKLMDLLKLDIEDFMISTSNGKKEVYQQELFLDVTDTDTNNIDYKTKNLEYKLNEFDNLDDFQPVNKFNTLETFAGAGGLQLGLEEANLLTTAAVEIDKYAAETLRINTNNTTIIQEDINKIADNGLHNYLAKKEVNSIDVLSGGYPCQSFSYAGKRKGLADVRGTLFYPYAKLLKQIKPKLFIVENVKGLVNHDNGRTLYTMIDIFERMGYKVHWNVFNSWNYGVAQKRERIVIIGIREDLKKEEKYSFKFPSPTSEKPVLRDVLKDVPESPGTSYSDKKKKVMDLVPPGGCWIDLPASIAKEYMGKSYYSGGGKRGMARRLSWSEPSLTLTTSPNQKQTERCHPDETRPFKVREYARIQSFPDNWTFAGSISNQYKQIGNAVPVNLARYIGLAVNSYLSQFKKTS